MMIAVILEINTYILKHNDLYAFVFQNFFSIILSTMHEKIAQYSKQHRVIKKKNRFSRNNTHERYMEIKQQPIVRQNGSRGL